MARIGSIPGLPTEQDIQLTLSVFMYLTFVFPRRLDSHITCCIKTGVCSPCPVLVMTTHRARPLPGTHTRARTQIHTRTCMHIRMRTLNIHVHWSDVDPRPSLAQAHARSTGNAPSSTISAWGSHGRRQSQDTVRTLCIQSTAK